MIPRPCAPCTPEAVGLALLGWPSVSVTPPEYGRHRERRSVVAQRPAVSWSTAIRARLFVVSYAPLAAMLAVTHSTTVWPPLGHLAFWFFCLAAVVGFADGIRLPRGLRSKSNRTVSLSDIHDEGVAVAAYLATYLLPLLGLKVTGWRDAVALALYFAVLLVVFLQTDLALVNPTLYMTGWRVVSGAWEDRRVLLLLPARRAVAEHEKLSVVTMDRFLILDEGQTK